MFLGILNLTPDSFSDGGRFMDPAAAVTQAEALVASGAGMLDLGAESTRPGAVPVDGAEEWARLEAPLGALRARFPNLPLSLDTRHAETAARGLAEGVAFLNDVTGFSDPAMLALARESRCGLIAMRNRVQDGAFLMPPYGESGEPTAERIIAELAEVRDRLLNAGIAQERILLDPGFGFGTTYREDLALWNAMADLPRRLSWPVERFCIGISRKRFLAWRNGTPDLPAEQRDGLTAEAHRALFDLGYRVFRSHRCQQALPRPLGPILLRPMRPADLAVFRAYRSDPELGRYQDWEPMSDGEAADFLAAMGALDGPAPGRWWQIAIADAASDVLLGDIGLYLTEDGREAEIGFTVASAHHGKGIASRAVGEALRLLFERTHASLVKGVTDARNLASIRTLERLGMKRASEIQATFRGEPCLEYVYYLHRPESRR